MTLVYNIKGGGGFISESNYSSSIASGPLSLNIEQMRDEIKRFISKNHEKTIYSNPVRYMIETIKGGDKETEPIEPPLGTGSETETKINSELIEHMKKEIKSLKLNDEQEVDVQVLDAEDVKGSDYGFNFEQMKEHTAYIIPPVNLNTFSFIHFIDLVGHYFDHCYVIKCGLDDSYTERIVVYIGQRLTDSSPTSKLYIPTNERSFIDFMYLIYARALFVLKSSDDEYKSYTNACVKLFHNV